MRFIAWFDDKIYSILSGLALNVNTPGLILKILSMSKDTNIQQYITYNHNCDVETLIRLSNSKSDFVLCGVYCNRKTPFYILEKLALSESFFIRRNMCYDSTLDRPIGKLREASIDLKFLLDEPRRGIIFVNNTTRFNCA